MNREMVSDCCKSSWMNWDGWPVCGTCANNCVLVEKRPFTAPTVKGTPRHV